MPDDIDGYSISTSRSTDLLAPTVKGGGGSPLTAEDGAWSVLSASLFPQLPLEELPLKVHLLRVVILGFLGAYYTSLSVRVLGSKLPHH